MKRSGQVVPSQATSVRGMPAAVTGRAGHCRVTALCAFVEVAAAAPPIESIGRVGSFACDPVLGAGAGDGRSPGRSLARGRTCRSQSGIPGEIGRSTLPHSTQTVLPGGRRVLERRGVSAADPMIHAATGAAFMTTLGRS